MDIRVIYGGTSQVGSFIIVLPSATQSQSYSLLLMVHNVSGSREARAQRAGQNLAEEKGILAQTSEQI